jgi:isocitrate/isopropylmalate dehydrogenase
MIDQKLQCHGSAPDLAPITTNNSLAEILLICLALRFKGLIAYSKTACKRAYIPCSSTFL